jgi:hypothetical protein
METGQFPQQIFTTYLKTIRHLGTGPFGDGTFSTESHAMHIFKRDGTYQVSLTITNSGGPDTTIIGGIEG